MEHIMTTALCHRCEYRALALENKNSIVVIVLPRSDCNRINTFVTTCYNYRPVKPILLTRSDENDKRQLFKDFLFTTNSKRVCDNTVNSNLKLKTIIVNDTTYMFVWDYIMPHTIVTLCKKIYTKIKQLFILSNKHTTYYCD